MFSFVFYDPRWFVVTGSQQKQSAELERERLDNGLCPKCGQPGEFIRMALVCDEHGPYAGC